MPFFNNDDKNMKHNAFTLVELLIVVFILSLLLAGGYMVLSTGQSTWYATDVNIRLQENLRKVIEKLSVELRQTQVAQQQILDAAGANNTDVVRFSIPIICQAGGSLLNPSGDVAYWGAPLTWGCTDVSCSDADGDCAVLEYKYIEYRVNANQQLTRRILNSVLNVVREDVLAQNILDFQMRLNGKVMTMDTAIQMTSALNRQLTAQRSAEILLRN